MTARFVLPTATALAALLASGQVFADANVQLRVLETTDIHVHIVDYDYFQDRPSVTVGAESIPQDVGVRHDANEQIVEVMRDAAGQNTEALQLLRMLDLRLECPAFLLGLLQCRDVCGNPHYSVRGAGPVHRL